MEHRGHLGTRGGLALAVFVFAFSAPASAYEVTDPRGLLVKLDQYLAGSTFDTAFKLGDDAEGTRLTKDCSVSCGADGCGSMCTNSNEPMSRQVTVLAGDAATIENDDGTTEAWSRDQFTALNGNAVRQSLPTLDFQIAGSLEASEFNDKTYALGDQTLNCKEIVFLFHPNGAGGVTFKIRYVVSKDVPFAGQVVQMAAFGEYLFKLTSVKRQ